MSNARTEAAITPDNTVRIIQAEAATAFFACVLSEISRSEHPGLSIASKLAMLNAYVSSARTGTDLHRAYQGEALMPAYYLATEATLSFGLLAMANLIEGNPVSFVLSANACVLGGVMMRRIYGDEGLADLAANTYSALKQAPQKMFHGVMNFFANKPAVEEQPDVTLAMKKNQ